MTIQGKSIQFFNDAKEESNLRQVGVAMLNGSLIFNLSLPLRRELWKYEVNGFSATEFFALQYVERDTGFNALELIVLWFNFEIAWRA